MENRAGPWEWQWIPECCPLPVVLLCSSGKWALILGSGRASRALANGLWEGRLGAAGQPGHRVPVLWAKVRGCP